MLPRRLGFGAIVAMLSLASCAPGVAQEQDPDLTGAMVLESAAGCRFDPLTDHALEGVLLETNGMIHAPRVFVGSLSLVPRLEQHVEEGGSGKAVFTKARAAFPPNTRWHGLTPLALHGYYVDNPESDHYEERGIVFAETPEDLQSALHRMGQDVPLPPSSLELTEPGPYTGGCGGSIEIRREGAGSALVCGYGC
jgi:hypothetical protein